MTFSATEIARRRVAWATTAKTGSRSALAPLPRTRRPRSVS